MTLEFLGSVPDVDIERVETCCQAAVEGRERFDVTLNAVGAFPNSRRARTLWVGASEGARQLATIASALRRELASNRLRHEDRDFKPHLTIARVRRPMSVKKLLGSDCTVDVSMPVVAVTLFESCIGDGPLRYVELAEFDLRK